MLAHAFLTVTTARERDSQPTPGGLIALTVNEFRRLFTQLVAKAPAPRATCCTGPAGDANTKPPPGPATTAAKKITNNGCSTRLLR